MGKKKAVRTTTTTNDRVQALIRNPEYLKDLHALQDIRRVKDDSETRHEQKSYREKYNELITRYKITVPLDPEWVKKYSKETIESAALFTDDYIAKVIPQNEARMVDVGTRIEDGKEILTGRWDIGPHLRDGKYLLVELNLEEKKERILAKLESLIHLYRRHYAREVARDTESRKIDKFLVWDEYLSTRNFSQLARKHKVKVNTVRASYYRAFESIMGQEYDPNKHNRKIVKKEQLAITCDICKSRSKCKTLCPAVFAYADQDYVGQKERQSIDPLGSLADKE